MKTLRRILSVAALAVGVTGLARADTVISYTVIVPATPTELTNFLAQITAWHPGASGSFDTVASDSSSYVSGQTGFASGVTMASLNAANTTYTLKSYDILISSAISGTFSATALTDNASGSVHVSSYTAASLGSTMSALTSASDPANDLFTSGSTPPGGGPNPTTTNSAFGPLSNGTSTANISFSKSNSTDLGDYLVNGGPPSGHSYTPISSDLSVVTTADPLNIYLSTLTSAVISINTGNASAVQHTTVGETITVVYDYTSAVGPSAPEPATFALMGGSLIGLGLLGKRLKKS
jgi:hypothetical protein